MKFNKIALGVLCSMVCAVGSAQADMAQNQAQLDALTQKISDLKQQVAHLDGSSIRSNTSLGQRAFSAAQGTGIQEDTRGYFEMLPSNTFAFALLQNRDLYANQTLILGGYLQQDLQYWTGDTYPSDSTIQEKGTELSLSTINIDALYNVNNWVQAFVSYQVLGATPQTGSGSPEINKAFLTFGNLSQSPFYATVGKSLLPFGAFNGNGVWVDELPKTYFRPKNTPAIQGGYYADGLNASVSVFSNAMGHQVSDFTAALNYLDQLDKDWSYSLGTSFMNDARGADSRYGASYTKDTAQSSHGTNPVVDFNGAVSYQIYSMSAEIAHTLDSTYNEENENIGKTTAWYVGGSATPALMGQPTTFGLTYSAAKNVAGISAYAPSDINNSALSSNGIKSEWITYVSRPIFKNWIGGLELARTTMVGGSVVNVVTVDSSLYF